MWKILTRSTDWPPLLWWKFRSLTDGTTCTLYFGAASRAWYTTHIDGRDEPVEQFIDLLTPEDLAAAAAAAIAYRGEE